MSGASTGLLVLVGLLGLNDGLGTSPPSSADGSDVVQHVGLGESSSGSSLLRSRRLVVTGETNVATTTSGARASNRVAQMATARGGNVTMTIRAAHNTFTVVEVADPNEARAFQEQAERSGLRVEEDQQRFLATSSASVTRTQPLAEETPWGIERVYNGAVPNASFFPSAVTHPLCIIDSGYLLAHPDLPSDATAADPSQADPAGTMYFGGDLCDHGTHVLILSAAPLPTTSSAPPSARGAPSTPHTSFIISISPPSTILSPALRPTRHACRGHHRGHPWQRGWRGRCLSGRAWPEDSQGVWAGRLARRPQHALPE